MTGKDLVPPENATEEQKALDYYYVVVGGTNVTYKTLNIFGRAHIILCDGATLTCTGGILVEKEHNF